MSLLLFFTGESPSAIFIVSPTAAESGIPADSPNLTEIFVPSPGDFGILQERLNPTEVFVSSLVDSNISTEPLILVEVFVSSSQDTRILTETPSTSFVFVPQSSDGHFVLDYTNDVLIAVDQDTLTEVFASSPSDINIYTETPSVSIVFDLSSVVEGKIFSETPSISVLFDLSGTLDVFVPGTHTYNETPSITFVLLPAISSDIQTKTFYLKDALAGSSNHLSLQDEGVPPTTATTATGWTVGLTTTITPYSLMDSQTKRLASTFGAVALPNEQPNVSLGDSFRSETVFDGIFSPGDWVLDVPVIAVANGGSQSGRIRFRLWRASRQDGADGIEITSGAQVCSTITNLTTGTPQITRLDLNLGAISLGNEYLFLQLAWEITGVAAGVDNDVLIRVGTDARLRTPLFTPDVVNTYNEEIDATFVFSPSSGDVSLNVDAPIMAFSLPFQPIHISNLRGWFAGDQIKGVPDNTSLPAWADASGIGDVSQPIGSAQPTYRSDDGQVKALIHFDGSSQYFVFPPSALGDFRNVGFGAIFAVVKSDTGAGRSIVSFSTPAGGSTGRFYLRESNGSYQIFGRRLDADGASSVSGGVASSTLFTTLSAIMNWTNARIRLFQDGASVAEGSLPTAGNTSDTDSAAADLGVRDDIFGFFAGDITEILLYNGILLDSDRKRIEQYLDNKYAISGGTPFLRPDLAVFPEIQTTPVVFSPSVVDSFVPGHQIFTETPNVTFVTLPSTLDITVLVDNQTAVVGFFPSEQDQANLIDNDTLISSLLSTILESQVAGDVITTILAGIPTTIDQAVFIDAQTPVFITLPSPGDVGQFVDSDTAILVGLISPSDIEISIENPSLIKVFNLSSIDAAVDQENSSLIEIFDPSNTTDSLTGHGVTYNEPVTTTFVILPLESDTLTGVESNSLIFVLLPSELESVIFGDAPNTAIGLSFRPTHLSGLQGWFAADQIKGLPDGTALPAWADASGNQLDVSQSVGANQPIYKSNSWVSPVIRITLAGQGLNFPSSAFGIYRNIPGGTMFVAAQSNTNSSSQYLVTFTTAAGGSVDRLSLTISGGAQAYRALSRRLDADAPAPTFVTGGIIDTTAIAVLSGIADWSHGILRLFVNGVYVGESAYPTSGNSDDTDSGSANIGIRGDGALSWIGDIGEIILYNRLLTVTEQQQVEGYLKNKYLIGGGSVPVATDVSIFPEIQSITEVFSLSVVDSLVSHGITETPTVSFAFLPTETDAALLIDNQTAVAGFPTTEQDQAIDQEINTIATTVSGTSGDAAIAQDADVSIEVFNLSTSDQAVDQESSSLIEVFLPTVTDTVGGQIFTETPSINFVFLPVSDSNHYVPNAAEDQLIAADADTLIEVFFPSESDVYIPAGGGQVFNESPTIIFVILPTDIDAAVLVDQQTVVTNTINSSVDLAVFVDSDTTISSVLSTILENQTVGETITTTMAGLPVTLDQASLTDALTMIAVETTSDVDSATLVDNQSITEVFQVTISDVYIQASGENLSQTIIFVSSELDTARDVEFPSLIGILLGSPTDVVTSQESQTQPFILTITVFDQIVRIESPIVNTVFVQSEQDNSIDDETNSLGLIASLLTTGDAQQGVESPSIPFSGLMLPVDSANFVDILSQAAVVLPSEIDDLIKGGFQETPTTVLAFLNTEIDQASLADVITAGSTTITTSGDVEVSPESALQSLLFLLSETDVFIPGALSSGQSLSGFKVIVSGRPGLTTKVSNIGRNILVSARNRLIKVSGKGSLT